MENKKWIKCLPLFGTAISTIETIQAVAERNAKKAFWKLGETAVGRAIDAFTVFTVGTAAIAATSAKTAAKVAVSTAVKNVAGATFVRTDCTTVAGNEAEKCGGSGGTSADGSGSGSSDASSGGSTTGVESCDASGGSSGSGGGDRPWKKEKSDHEMELDYEDSPITRVVTDSYGRVSHFLIN